REGGAKRAPPAARDADRARSASAAVAAPAAATPPTPSARRAPSAGSRSSDALPSPGRRRGRRSPPRAQTSAAGSRKARHHQTRDLSLLLVWRRRDEAESQAGRHASGWRRSLERENPKNPQQASGELGVSSF